MKRILLWIGVILIGLIGFGLWMSQKTPPMPTDAEITRRENIQKDWAISLKKLVATGNSEAKAVSEMVERKTTLAVPVEGGFFVMNQSQPIGLMILTPQDSKYSFWAPELAKNSGATFFQEQKLLVLKSKAEYGWKTKSLILVHDGTHVLHFLKKGVLFKDIKEFCNEERDTYLSSNSVLLSLGGKEYLDFRADVISDIMKKAEALKGDADVSVSPSLYPRIDSIFGPFLNEKERAQWIGSIGIDIAFRFIDEFSAGTQTEKDDLKSIVVCEYYKKQKLL